MTLVLYTSQVNYSWQKSLDYKKLFYKKAAAQNPKNGTWNIWPSTTTKYTAHIDYYTQILNVYDMQ